MRARGKVPGRGSGARGRSKKIFFEPRPFEENFLRTPGVRTRARAKGGAGEIALSKIIYFRFVLCAEGASSGKNLKGLR